MSSKKAPHHTHHNSEAQASDDVVLEETEMEGVGMGTKLKQLRADYAEAQKERDEYLAGWQRAKADLVNFRRMVDEDRAREAIRAKAAVIAAFIPALDSFESARVSPTWQNVDAEWRIGVERIHDQMKKTLETLGAVSFGAVGDSFDPVQHECMSVVPASDEAPDGTIVQVLQMGYRIDDEVVRPAKVVVAQTS